MSDDKDDKDDEYDSVFFMMGMHKIWAALIKEKGVDFTQTSSDDEDDKDDDLITPFTFQDFRSQKAVTTAEHPCWSLCADLCDSLKEIRKVPTSGYSGLKSEISEKCFSKPCYTALCSKFAPH